MKQMNRFACSVAIMWVENTKAAAATNDAGLESDRARARKNMETAPRSKWKKKRPCKAPMSPSGRIALIRASKLYCRWWYDPLAWKGMPPKMWGYQRGVSPD